MLDRLEGLLAPVRRKTIKTSLPARRDDTGWGKWWLGFQRVFRQCERQRLRCCDPQGKTAKLLQATAATRINEPSCVLLVDADVTARKCAVD